MKKIWFLVICILFIQNLSALNISIEKKSSGEVMIPELNEPAEFQLSITNYDSEQMLNFYNLVGLKMEPSGKILFKSGEVKIIDFVVSPIGDFKNRGNFIFNYYIKGSESEYDLKKSLTFVILDLEDVFEIGSGDINSEEQSVEIYVKNKVNKEFKNVNAVLSSVFFNLEKNFDIERYGTNSFIVYLNREDFRKLMAGFYTFSANISVETL